MFIWTFSTDYFCKIWDSAKSFLFLFEKLFVTKKARIWFFFYRFQIMVVRFQAFKRILWKPFFIGPAGIWFLSTDYFSKILDSLWQVFNKILSTYRKIGKLSTKYFQLTGRMSTEINHQTNQWLWWFGVQPRFYLREWR